MSHPTTSNTPAQTSSIVDRRAELQCLWDEMVQTSGLQDQQSQAAEASFRSTALMAASVPAISMEDVGVKVMLAAMLRASIDLPGPRSYALTMIERTITADMRVLQGPPLTEMV